jgi:uncharacterized membrane protein
MKRKYFLPVLVRNGGPMYKDNYPAQNRTNLGQREKIISMAAGGGMLALAAWRRSWLSIPLALTGGVFLLRGITGKSAVYDLADIRRARGAKSGILVERMVTVNRPRTEVYQFWRDFENLPRFMEHLESVDESYTGGEGATSRWVAKAPMGKTVDWMAEIVEERENEVIAWRSLPESMVETFGRVEFRDAPGERGTEVLVSLQYKPPGGSAGALVAKLFGEEPDVQIREDLRRFKQVIETGERATTIGQTSGRLSEVVKQRRELRDRQPKYEQRQRQRERVE